MIAAMNTAAVGSETTQIVSNTYAGGLSGGPMRLWLELPNGAVQRLNSKGSFRVPAGARPVMEAPGSGLGGISRSGTESSQTRRWRGVDSNFQFRARWATVSKLCPRPARSAIGAGVSSEQLLASPNTPTKRTRTFVKAAGR